MATYLITGVSRGLGFEFLRQISADEKNTVIGTVRDKAATDKKVASELQRSNIHIIQADMTSYASLKGIVEDVTRISGGSLDYIIANAAYVSSTSAFDPLGVLGNTPTELEEDLVVSFQTNVVGNIHLFNLLMPLVLKGRTKKVIAISTGMADIDVIAKFNVASGGPYSISKAALNAAVAKFAAQYGRDGVLFMSISPGLVDTGHYDDITEEQKKGAGELMAQFAEYAPNFTGPITTEASVKAVMSVVDKASVKAGDGGSFVSHFGTKQWL